jgi:hypothetical protein
MQELLRGLGFGAVSDLVTALRALLASVIAAGKVLDVVLANGTTETTARHGLGRAARGAAVIGASAVGAFTVDLVSTADTVTVRSSAAVGADTTVRLWVF